VFVIPDPRAEADAAATVAATLEEVRLAIHPAAGAYLPDGTVVDRRCGCGTRSGLA
jgi:hypothetical protein